MKKIVLSLCCLLALSACPAEETTKETTEAPPSGIATQETKTESHTDSNTDHALPVGNPEAGSQVFMAKGCAACHAISTLPDAKGQLGPALDGVATRAITRVNGVDAENYIKQSIEEPENYLVEGYTNLMAKGLKDQMSDQEYADLVAYLLTLKS